MPLPRELWDDVVPESTTVVGDVETFVAYVEHGDAWRDWCSRVQQCIQWMAEDIGMMSADIVQRLLERPQPAFNSSVVNTNQPRPRQ